LRRWFCCLVLGLAIPPCMAQVPDSAAAPKSTEGVIVTAPPLEKVLRDFIVSYAAPSPASGKVARWHAGVCPGVIGLPASWNSSISARVREVASLAGAPAADEKCHPNIDIVFTQNPQRLLDEVRATRSWLLGYHDKAQEKRLATVNHAIQAWYMTQTVDAKGGVHTDNKLRADGIYFQVGKGNTFYFPNAHVESWNGSRLGDDRRGELAHVLVVVDLAKVNGIKLSAVADDVAMLALAQTAAFEACQPVVSIANLTAPDCASKTDTLSASDQAYLHALYKIDIRASLVEQWGDLAYEMKKSLGGP
jgi:hypothetical protein